MARGQSDVPFTVIYSQKTSTKKTKRIKWNKICSFLSQAKGPVGRSTLIDFFKISEETLKRGISRRKCIQIVDVGVVKHNDKLHNMELMGHSIGGVGREFVPLNKGADLLPTWFDIRLEFEIHGETLSSLPDVPVCPLNLESKDIHDDFTWCDYMIQYQKGTITVTMKPKYVGHKFGLNRERYLEYRQKISEKILNKIGYIPRLYSLKFDLHQDDHRQPFHGDYKKNEAILGVLHLQEYAVLRKDKAKFPIRRREMNHLNPEGVILATVAQEVLTKSAEQISELNEVKQFYRTSRETQKILLSAIHGTINGINGVVEENSRQIHYVAENAAEQTYQMMMVRKQIEDYQVENNDVFQVLAANGQKLNQILETNQKELVMISDFLGSLMSEFQEWRDIDRDTKIKIVHSLREQGNSLREIRDIVNQYFKVSFQAISRYVNDQSSDESIDKSVDQSEKNGTKRQQKWDKTSTKMGQSVNFKQNDNQLVNQLIQNVKISPGMNTRKLIKSVRGDTTHILKIIHNMVDAGIIEKITVKNSFTYFISSSSRNEQGKGVNVNV